MLAAPAYASCGAASRYALGADGAGAARPAPAASLISASRYALGARRTALRAEGAARLCAKRRSRWLPSPPRATRSPPRAWARDRRQSREGDPAEPVYVLGGAVEDPRLLQYDPHIAPRNNRKVQLLTYHVLRGSTVGQIGRGPALAIM